MKKINKYEVVKILLLVSFLTTLFLAVVSLTIFPDNEIVNNMHLFAGAIFSIIAIIHIISNSKKKAH